MEKTLIIIGSGNEGASDLETCKIAGTMMLAGDSIVGFEHDIDAFAMWCVNGKMFQKAIDMREEKGLNTDFDKYSFYMNKGFTHLPLPLYGAGDVMYAIQVGIHLEYEKIVLVDCPLDDYEPYQAGFKQAYESLKDKVRSMSGFTKDLFGEPTDEWLNA